MSTEILRRAAALMRERAEAAYPRTRGLCDDWFDEGASDLAHLRPQEAAHIASWHPAVAPAVADWLDDALEAHLRVRPGNYPSYLKALTVARAYLGGAG